METVNDGQHFLNFSLFLFFVNIARNKYQKVNLSSCFVFIFRSAISRKCTGNKIYL